MVNRGIAPLDPDTPIGQFRLASGDREYVALTPPEAGYGDYKIWSDDEITSYLTLTGSNVPRAIAIGYRNIAASISADSIKTDDLAMAGKEEVEKWERLADKWDAIADKADGAAVDDYFELADIGSPRHYRPPEASPWLRRC